MTFKEYINNPLGKANSVISHREMYRNLYTEKLDKIMVRENGKVEYTLYQTSKSYICHIKVPSEVIDKFYYDVVVEFSKTKGEKDLSNAEVKFYSNDPSFVFTFAHAFIKNKMFIDKLEDMMSKLAVKNRAVEKNPSNQVGYVKSLYFAFLLMNKKGLFSTIKYTAHGKTYSDKILKSNIIHADEKIKSRQEAQDELTESKKRTKKKEVDVTRDRKNIINTATGNTIKSGGMVHHVKRTGLAKHSTASVGSSGKYGVKKTKRI